VTDTNDKKLVGSRVCVLCITFAFHYC